MDHPGIACSGSGHATASKGYEFNLFSHYRRKYSCSVNLARFSERCAEIPSLALSYPLY
jgi:hypothetical protein